MEKTYTKEEVLEAIKRAFFSGIEAGQTEYGGEAFSAEDYLPGDELEAPPIPQILKADTDPNY